MKKIYLPLIAVLAGLASSTLTGCIEETFPTGTVTQDQLEQSPNNMSAAAMGMAAFMNKISILPGSTRHYDWGYGSQMKIRDILTGDYFDVSSGYDQYVRWGTNKNQGEDYIFPQLVWWFYTKQAQTANVAISSYNAETATEEQSYYLGTAYAMRAMTYLDMARLYEYLPTDATSPINRYNHDVTRLTVPIVTENMTEEEARHNPRATHDQMMAFIISDLDKAEEYMGDYELSGVHTLPTLAVVYGLKARAYLWDEDYSKAAEFASKAINAHGGSPMNQSQWLSTTSGFNTHVPSWMLEESLQLEDDQVQSGIINWTSWQSNEALWGYVSAGPYVSIDAKLYNSISDEDFRKLTFVAPAGSALSGQENFINKAYLNAYGVRLPAYASLKVKPNSGLAGMLDYTVGAVSSWPLMRVEEMYFIEAEATAHTSATQGKQLLEQFMQTYRYPTYECPGSTTEAVVDEIFLQKRIEFFGEGIIFFDYKRLDKPVTRYYSGSNWPTDRQFNTETRPAWMNMVFVSTEGENNDDVLEYNNPDPSDCYENLGE